MPSLYPPEIVHNQFTDAVVAPTVAPMKAVRVFRTAFNRAIHNTVTQPVVQLRDIVLQVPATGVATGKSFDGYPGANVRSNSREKRLHFAPDVETIHLHWDLGGASQITVLAFEVYKTNTPAPLYRATMNFVVGACPPAGHFSWNGRLDQPLVCASAAVVYTPNYLPAEFPGDALCVEQGPYKFKLVVLDPGATLVRITPARWVYADVLLGKPTLEWLPRNTLAASPMLPTNGLAPVERDHQVYDSLTDANDHENLSGAVPAPGQTKRVYLQAHAFYCAEAELIENWAWRQFHAIWGDGANIPLRLAPSVLRSDNTLVTGAAALRALGAVEFVWEWLDAAPTPPGDLYRYLPGGVAQDDSDRGQAAAHAFVTGAANFDVATTFPPGRNCHVERGGKRGPNAPPVFPMHPGTAEFPFAVTNPVAGNWCALSALAQAGSEAGHTGVILQPSIQPGDGFRLRVAPVVAGLVVPTAAHGAFHTAMNDVPIRVTADTGAFVVWKSVEHTVYNSDPAGLQQAHCNAVAERFASLHIRIRSQVRTIAPYTAALGALYNSTAAAAAQLEPVVQLALAGAAAHVDNGVAAWFKPWATFKADLIAQRGSVANAAAWADAYIHPTRTFWRDGIRRPFAAPWPTDPVVFTDNAVGDGITASVKITGQHGALIGDDTQPAASVDVLAAAVKTAMGMVHMVTQSMYVGGDPALTVEVRCPNARRADATAAVTAGIAAYTDGQCESAYEASAGYAWGFRVVDLVLQDWLGQDDGLITLQFTQGSNFIGSPAGKAGFASATRASINIFMLKTNLMQGTLCHEFGHAMFVNHPHTEQPVNDPRELHDASGILHCTMRTPAAQGNFCGFCMLRLRAWSIYKLDGNRAAEAIHPAPVLVVPDMHVRTLLRTGAQNTR